MGRGVDWDELPHPWQVAFEQAWAAYCAGSLPIGAVVADREDSVVLSGRNRMYEERGEGRLAGNHLAHAEMNALMPLAPNEVDPRACVLYSTMEPCPMCCGAIRMIKIGAVHYAARDPVAGSVSLLDSTPFMRRAGITVTGPTRLRLEVFSVALNVAAFLELHEDTEIPVRMMTMYQPILPDAVWLGQTIHDMGMLGRLRDAEVSVSEVYAAVLQDLRPSR